MFPRRAVVATALVLACACESPAVVSSEEAPAAPHPLVRADAWETTPAPLDPEPTHRPDPVVCPLHPWRAEDRGIEIDTTQCNYASLSQPLLRDVVAGDTLLVDAWWSTLLSTEPAVGHIAVYIGDELLWDEHVAIPGDADARSLELSAPFDAMAGEPITLHVHNHGYNTWSFNPLQVVSTITP